MKKIILTVLFALTILLIGGCASSTSTRKPQTSTQAEDSGTTTHIVAVLTQIDTENKNISFLDADTFSANIYAYRTGTEVINKTGRAISISDISAGEVVDLYYDTGSKMISKIQISVNDNVWENTKVTNFSVDYTTHSMKVGQTLYSYNDKTAVFSNNEKIDIDEINSEDQLIVRGYGTKILSIVVDKGHGYITLEGDGLFIGGMIEVGGRIVKIIERSMIVIVQEGTYKVTVRNGQYTASKNVTISRNEQSIVSFADVMAEVIETGNIRFDIDVEGAELYIDNVKTNYDSVVSMSTGRHSIKVTADGYDDYTDTIDVTLTYETIDIDLKRTEEETTESKTDEEETEEEETEGETKVSTVNDVTISGPTGGMIYFDGKYVGVAPVTFDLVTGTHVITVLMGTEINSYTVTLAEGGDDVVYDFTVDEE